MAYPQEIFVSGGGLVRQSNAFDTAEVLTAAAGVYGSYIAHHPVVVSRFTFQISTAVDDLTASVVEMQKVTLADVTSSIGIMTVADGAAAQKVYWKDVTPTKIGVGEKLQFKHLTQGDLGGTPAGAGFYGFLGSFQPEYMTNETNAVAG